MFSFLLFWLWSSSHPSSCHMKNFMYFCKTKYTFVHYSDIFIIMGVLLGPLRKWGITVHVELDGEGWILVMIAPIVKSVRVGLAWSRRDSVDQPFHTSPSLLWHKLCIWLNKYSNPGVVSTHSDLKTVTWHTKTMRVVNDWNPVRITIDEHFLVRIEKYVMMVIPNKIGYLFI